MRELSPWAKKSEGRNRARAFYAAYISSSAWYRRRIQWAEEELHRIKPARIMCMGQCGREWKVSRDDLHHSSYDRLVDEDHEDLWPLCRGCHDLVHHLIGSSKTWRRMDRWVANQQAILIVQDRNQSPGGKGRGASLRDYL